MTVPSSKTTEQRESRRQKITPHLWFDDQAEEAARFYTSLFPASRMGGVTHYSDEGKEIHGREAGTVMTVEFELDGTKFVALNGGPHFTFTPAISFFVTCPTPEEVDQLWERLSDGGSALMELDSYEWSERYGWVQDRYGLSWQLFHGEQGSAGRKIAPCLLFTGEHPRAQVAMGFYTSVFPPAGIESVNHHPEGGELSGMVAQAQFRLDDEVFMAMDGGPYHAFTFNEATSLLLNCESQAQIDHFWNLLGEGGDPSAQQCGWLKDRYGVSWQVTPTVLGKMLTDPDQDKVRRLTRAFLAMKKLEIGALEAAYRGHDA